jgi:hypothetical protein
MDVILKEEQAYQKGSKHKGWANFRDTNPYKQRYNTEWEKHLYDAPKVRPNKSVKQLMDHVISEGTRIFADSNCAHTWMIYHDHLKIWWEKETQAYLKTLPCPIEGWESRTNGTIETMG